MCASFAILPISIELSNRFEPSTLSEDNNNIELVERGRSAHQKKKKEHQKKIVFNDNSCNIIRAFVFSFFSFLLFCQSIRSPALFSLPLSQYVFESKCYAISEQDPASVIIFNGSMWPYVDLYSVQRTCANVHVSKYKVCICAIFSRQFMTIFVFPSKCINTTKHKPFAVDNVIALVKIETNKISGE